MKKIILVSGSNATGKTALLKWMIPYLKQKEENCAVCKIDCINDEDKYVFQKFKIPVCSGISQDICPDHFLVSNLTELYQWATKKMTDYLFIETAGLCNRCSPATAQILSICVVDATSSHKAASHLGPMLTQADYIVITKIDMISQAEKEIIYHNIRAINTTAKVFTIDALSGYGTESIARSILQEPITHSYENDTLRHTMPAGVCSYCLGEKRIGSAYQQGTVYKIPLSGE